MNDIIKCKCGCGKELLRLDKRGRKRKYIHGHHKSFLGKHHTKETKEKLKIIKWKGGEKASNLRYYKKNKGKLLKQSTEYIKKHPEQRKKTIYKYNNSPKAFFRTLKSNSKRRKMEFKLKQEDFLNWYQNQKKNCFYCDIPEKALKSNPLFMRPLKTKEVRFRLSIDRKNNELSYQLNNIVLACRLCNSIKNNVFSAKEMKEIAEKYIKPKWKK